MEDLIKNLHQWLNKLTTFKLPDWNSLPDLDLYMDQVMTYLERELSPLVVDGQEKMITTWMINNYVKGNLLSAPVQKKYSKEHLAYLFAICSIKQILSMSDISRLFTYQKEVTENNDIIYDFFRTTQAEMINSIASETIKKIEPFLNNDVDIKENDVTKFLNNFVFKLAIEAEVKKIIASKIMNHLSSYSDKEKSKHEEKEKSGQEKLENKDKDKKNKK